MRTAMVEDTVTTLITGNLIKDSLGVFTIKDMEGKFIPWHD